MLQINRYPWLVLVGAVKDGETKPSFGCGGTIVASRYIISAAHCFDVFGTSPGGIYVWIGEHNPDITGETRLPEVLIRRVVGIEGWKLNIIATGSVVKQG